MCRRFLALLLAAGVASPAAAQGLTSLFATGRGGDEPSSLALSFLHLSTDPAVLALTQFTVIGTNPGGAVVSSLGDGVVLPVADLSPANPFYLPLSYGGYAFGGGAYPAGVLSTFPNLNASGPAAPTTAVPTLAVTLKLAEGGKAGSLSYTASDADGGLVGGATLPIPVDGWWVLGFGAVNQPVVDPLPTDPAPTADPAANPPGPPGPSQVPEPATLLLAGVGLAAALVRTRRGRID